MSLAQEELDVPSHEDELDRWLAARERNRPVTELRLRLPSDVFDRLASLAAAREVSPEHLAAQAVCGLVERLEIQEDVERSREDFARGNWFDNDEVERFFAAKKRALLESGAVR